MKITSIELMSSNWIMPRLISWFNAQLPADRTIPATQLYIIKVAVLVTADGTPVFAIGTDPSQVDPVASGREFIGDATFLWVGPTDVPVTATSDHFFELAKSMQPYVNVVPYTLTAHEGTVIPFTVVVNEIAQVV